MDFSEKRRTITKQYYSELLDQFDKKMKEIRFYLAKKEVLLYHGNAPAHSFGIVADNLYELQPRPPNSPELAPCDFAVSQHENVGRGRKFSSNEEIIVETEAYFNEFDKSYFLRV